MDRFSFLNAAHTEFFAQLYDQYLENPDSVEPSWRGFFQGFDFGISKYYGENPSAQFENLASSNGESNAASEKLQKEFQVIKLIDAYRTRGHLFTRTNPVHKRRTYSPTLDIENFGLSKADLSTVFDAAKVIKIAPCSLADILGHLDKIYCQSIGVEYMYIRNPNDIQWIQNKIGHNDNQPNFSPAEIGRASCRERVLF